MNNLDKSYQFLLKYILSHGIEKQDRTGTGTLSVFGWQFRHNMSEGFPLLTTKKMAWKSIVTELLWFLRGDTNIKYLLENNCHIWTGDAYKRYAEAHRKEWADKIPPHLLEESIISVKDFEQTIKTSPEFAKTWGELGPIYGKQWRKWQGWIDMRGNEKGSIWHDQIARLIYNLKTNPDSRRLMVNAWNVAELDQMVLPPCHYGFQVYTRELTGEERWDLLKKKVGDKSFQLMVDNIVPFGGGLSEELQVYSIPKRAISLMWNQRSVDTFLGLPFNIASYGLLLEIIAKEVNMIPDELIGNLGDVHLYKNHIEQANEQISRTSYELPTIKIEDEVKWEINDCLPYYSPSDFTLENYESHPTIKAPLSN